VSAPQAGTLQLLTRRQAGGVGDGVNVEESISVGADYRGQRYSYQEAIFHVPGLHVFPGQTEAYPAEYHIHMRTLSAPQRALTLVLPVSHRVTGPGQEYFAAMAAQPNPATTDRPTLESLLTPGADIIQYQGPDIRGRTRDNPTPEPQCAAATPADERQFLLVLAPCQIRAADLERIPREGSASSDPRDLPAPGVAPSQGVPRDRLRTTAVLARPGIARQATAMKTLGDSSGATTELQCLPLEVVGGKDVVVDASGRAIPLTQLLGGGGGGVFGATGPAATAAQQQANAFVVWIAQFIGAFVGLLVADWLVGFLWGVWFKNARVQAWEPLKLVAIVLVAIGAASLPTGWNLW
jgi:hypothetical protein